MNPHEKNFFAKEAVSSGMDSGKTKEIDEAEAEEEQDDKKQMCDFDQFLNDIDEN